MTGPAVVMMSAEQARVLTDEIKVSVQRTWTLLLAAYEERAWAALGYPSWRDYATTELALSQSRAYQLLDAAKVVRAIEGAAGSTDVELTEAAARDIKPHLDEVLDTVRDRTEGTSPEHVPAVVAEVIQEIRTGSPPSNGGEEHGVPSAPPRRRRPLPDAYRDAVYELGRAVGRLERLHADDRFLRLRAELRTRHQGDLVRTVTHALDLQTDLQAGP